MKKIRKQTFALEDIAAEVIFKSIKNMYLRVVPPLAEIKISAPHGTTMQTIRQFVFSRRLWILRRRQKIAENLPSLLRCEDGESCFLWGREYLLRVEERTDKRGVEQQDSSLTLLVPPGTHEEERMKILENWKREQLLKTVDTFLSFWEPRMGLKIAAVSFRRMKTRWGSCTSSRRTIRLNTALVSAPKEILEYVLVHEMAHIRESNHSSRFWSIVEEHLPGWKNLRKRLKDYSPENDGKS